MLICTKQFTWRNILRLKFEFNLDELIPFSRVAGCIGSINVWSILWFFCCCGFAGWSLGPSCGWQEKLSESEKYSSPEYFPALTLKFFISRGENELNSTKNPPVFDVRVTAKRDKLLCCIPTRCTNLSIFFILELKFYMFRRVPLSIIRSFHWTHSNVLFHRCWLTTCEKSMCSCPQALSKLVWYVHLLCVQWKTPDERVTVRNM